MTGTCHVAAWLPGCRQELAAVSRADQSWIIASIVSRRPEETWSYLTCGTGMHRLRRAEPVSTTITGAFPPFLLLVWTL
jgi:hypothetical protein